MTLLDIIQRKPDPEPWSEGEHIPWNDPEFSQRMLKEHLSQAHDAASRRYAIIDQHVGWIHNELLQGRPSRILDLGCGPGLYAGRLCQLGHTVTGIDFSPASIEYATRQAAPGCSFRLDDIRTADYGHGYDLVMLIFGEFNIFAPDTARSMLQRMAAALKEGGRLLLEPHTFQVVKEKGQAPNTWYSSEGDVFSERPHLILFENTWNETRKAANTRYYIIDSETAELTHFMESLQAYTNEEYERLLRETGFANVQVYPSLGEAMDEYEYGLQAITAQKAA